jgi:hypothetical protein
VGGDWGWVRRRLITRGTRLRDTSRKSPSKSRVHPLEVSTPFLFVRITPSTKRVRAHPLKSTVDARISSLADAGVSQGVYEVDPQSSSMGLVSLSFLAFVPMNSLAESAEEEYTTCERGLHEAWVAGKVGTIFCLGLRMGQI